MLLEELHYTCKFDTLLEERHFPNCLRVLNNLRHVFEIAQKIQQFGHLGRHSASYHRVTEAEEQHLHDALLADASLAVIPLRPPHGSQPAIT